MKRRSLMLTAVCLGAWTLAAVTLPNGVVLPKDWPPRIDLEDRSPMRAPYLEAANIPSPIPIDLGRQLFVDDFLVASTSGVVRIYGKPVKLPENPVLWPETPNELGAGVLCNQENPNLYFPRLSILSGCVMPGGGVWWDPTRRRFRMWYLPGMLGKLSYAESSDGLHWDRPRVSVRGDNVVLAGQDFDTYSVWPDYTAPDPYARWCLSVSPGGNPGRSALYTSDDGLFWTFRRHSGENDDSTTLFYDPFVGKWVWSMRAAWRDRSRVYHADPRFPEGADWNFSTYRNPTNTADCTAWLACDSADVPRTIDDGTVRSNAQLYNVDAVPYESIMLGLFKILSGRDNEEAAKKGLPKSTFVQFAYSRDGFHFTRPDRTPAIPESGWGSGQWDTGYVGPCSSGCVIKDERLWFYYTGFRGDGAATNSTDQSDFENNGLYHNGAIGVATLRRDGFVGFMTDARGTVTTRPVVFSGAHFFVNADARFGSLKVSVLDAEGRPIPGYTAADGEPFVRTDSTKHTYRWKGGDLARFAGKPVRFRFDLHLATLYSFWVSKRPTGESGGYVAAGGPAYPGPRDVAPDQTFSRSYP